MQYAKKYTKEITENGKKVRHQASMMPMFVLNISQKNHEGTHAGTYAYDLTGKDAGIDRFMAPFDLRVVAMDKTNGNFIVCQSINPVVCPNGYIGFVSMLLGHDNYIGDLAVGTVIKQGHAFYDEGTAGFATGNHIHIEVAQRVYDGGRYGIYDLNAQGTYHLRGNCPIQDVFFLDPKDTVKDNKHISFKTYTDNTTNQKPNLKPNATIANEVIKGLWGNGNDRKNRLTKAGYDYNAIQAIVNKKLL